MTTMTLPTPEQIADKIIHETHPLTTEEEEILESGNDKMALCFLLRKSNQEAFRAVAKELREMLPTIKLSASQCDALVTALIKHLEGEKVTER